MGEIVCFGEALIDFHAEPAGEAAAGQHFIPYAGGAPANAAAAVAKLGGPATYIGMLANDMFGDFLFESLQGAGVNTDYIRRTDEAPTALAFVSLDADGERRFSFYRPPAADLLFRSPHFNDTCFASATIFHACSNSMTEPESAETTLEGLRRARRAGALVSFDVNLRAALWPKNTDPLPWIWAALHEADVVKLCGVELAFLADPLGGEQALLDKLWQSNVKLLVLTDGAAPIRYVTRTGQGEVPIFQVKPINTTAAGDAFIAGVLYTLANQDINAEHLDAWLTERERLETALRFGAACGAITVTRHGAFSALPSLAQVNALLQEKA